MDIVDQFKKGYQTSEFWLSVIPSGIGAAAVLAPFFGYDIDSAQLTAAVAGFVPGVTYIFGRTWLKRKRVEAVVAVAPAVDEFDVAGEDLGDEAILPPPVD